MNAILPAGSSDQRTPRRTAVLRAVDAVRGAPRQPEIAIACVDRNTRNASLPGGWSNQRTPRRTAVLRAVDAVRGKPREIEIAIA